MVQEKKLLIIIGPTGIGKTDLSISLAKEYQTEIISCDSRQIFQEMKIGTAVPSPDQLIQVKHHFIGSKSIHDYYNVFNYETDVLSTLENLYKTKDIVILCGGSGLYLDAVLYGMDDIPDPDPEIRAKLTKRIETEGVKPLADELKKVDPEYHNEVDINNPKRVLRGLEIWESTGKKFSSFRIRKNPDRAFQPIFINLSIERTILYERINKRVNKMIDQGMEEEARNLYKYRKLNALNTVGFKEWFGHFDGDYSKEEAIRLIKRNTRHYAKRQITWNKKYPDALIENPQNIKEIISWINDMI